MHKIISNVLLENEKMQVSGELSATLPEPAVKITKSLTHRFTLLHFICSFVRDSLHLRLFIFDTPLIYPLNQSKNITRNVQASESRQGQALVVLLFANLEHYIKTISSHALEASADVVSKRNRPV